jgi:hypothetical protein
MKGPSREERREEERRENKTRGQGKYKACKVEEAETHIHIQRYIHIYLIAHTSIDTYAHKRQT